MIKFGCPNCGKKIGVGDDAAGKKAKCPGCGRILDIPQPTSLPRASGQEASKAVQSGSGTSVSNVQANSQLDELAAAMSETAGPSAKERAPSFPRAAATRQPGKKANRWILWAVLLGVVVVVVIGAMQMGRTGFAMGLTDIRKVTADPGAYAGQTLKSPVIMISVRYFSPIATVNAKGLQLTSSPALDSKAMKIHQSIGSHQAVMIKYRIYDQATLAKIEAYDSCIGVLLDVWIP